MTVGELITILQALPRDANVYVFQDVDPADDASRIQMKPKVLHEHGAVWIE